ncbi:hypothetical protein BCD48_00990 [Pseudofrankia sp. BMG5.36]|nr:hypothetical protein BCD48_00990 [Pseudofrankia sp. BMG5.36]
MLVLAHSDDDAPDLPLDMNAQVDQKIPVTFPRRGEVRRRLEKFADGSPCLADEIGLRELDDGQPRASRRPGRPSAFVTADDQVDKLSHV